MRNPEQHRANTSKATQGMRHPRAKPLGSRRIAFYANGLAYWKIKVSPTGTWPHEHRWLMEQKLGRRLLNSEHVHHRNHNSLDNSEHNLVLLSAADHIRHHTALQKGQWSLQFTACQICHTTTRKHEAKGLCLNCYAKNRYSSKTRQR